jgi:hypothetical protein
MSTTASPAQIEANRRNAQHSTGPKTPEGKAASSMNALKCAIHSRQVVVQGRCLQEDEQEFTGFHQRLWDDLKPVGVLEEILADQIVTTHWRLRRALKAESAEIVLSVDGGQSFRSENESKDLSRLEWFMPHPVTGKLVDPVPRMMESSDGISLIMRIWKSFRKRLDETGVICEYVFEAITDIFNKHPNSLIFDIKGVLSRLEDEDRAKPAVVMEHCFRFIDSRLETLSQELAKCQEREQIEEQARQSAQALPHPDIVDKLMRYIKALERQLFQSMNQLERLQRRRQGENVPPPVAVEVSGAV